MRIWDIDPGYLNRQSLLGEHRELHGMVSIFRHNKQGYSRHPETLRWKSLGWALRQRHQQLSAEMALRGYTDRSPVNLRSKKEEWPTEFIDTPSAQYQILLEKYRNKSPGRIPLPSTTYQIWAQHKYSVLARSESAYRELGRRVAQQKDKHDLDELAVELVSWLRIPPKPGPTRNALLHMWGYVSDLYTGNKNGIESWSLKRLLQQVQVLQQIQEDDYLGHSTALGELGSWL